MSELESESWHVVQPRSARGKTVEQDRGVGRLRWRRTREKIRTADDRPLGDNHKIQRTANGDDAQQPKTRLYNGNSKESDEQEILRGACDPALQQKNSAKDDAIILDKVGLPFRTREGFTYQNSERRRGRGEGVRDRCGRPGDGVTAKMERFSGEVSKSQPQRGILRIGAGVELRRGEGVKVQRVKAEPEFSLQNEQDWPSIAGRDGMEEGDSAKGKSWTMVVKTHPPPLIRRKPSKPPPGDASDSEDEVNELVRKKKKKKKRGGGEQGGGEQRQAQPLTLELGSMFENLKAQRSTKVVVAGGAPLLHKGSNSKSPVKGLNKLTGSKEPAPRNVLDSSAPSMRRGKERETPKKKKPTPLRKVISKEKEEKKKLREQGLPIPVNFDATKEPRSDVELSHSEDESGPETPPTIHNRKFREYCTHITNKDLNARVELLLSELVRFQDRQFLLNPAKAKAKRRYVCGLREVTKHLKLKRLRCVVMPPNLEKIQSTGGLNELVGQIATLCGEQGVPMVFAMSRRRLAYVLKKKHNIGCVGIFSYDGAEAHYKKLMQLVEEASEEYDSRMSALQQRCDPPEQDCAVTLDDVTPLVTPPGDGDAEEGLSQGSADTYFSHKSEPGFTDEEEEPAHQNGTHSVHPEHWNGAHAVRLEHDNGTSQNGDITKTPWNIFFKSKSSAYSAARHVTQQNGVETSQDLLVHDLEGVADHTSTVPCSNGHPPPGETGFNVNAPTFVPSFKFELNINAAEFTPTTRTLPS